MTFALVATLTAKVTGAPAVGFVVDDEIVTPARAFTLTVTLPDWAPALTVTSAPADVVSVAVATPFASVTALVGVTVPFVVENVTGTPAIERPVSSVTTAVITEVPPEEPRVCGVAVTVTRPAAAIPTLTSFCADVPPD